MAKQFGYNLLAFVYFANQDRGTAKLVLKKKTCKYIIKLYMKNKNLPLSDKVKLLANFLNSNAVCKISAVDTELAILHNLIDEIVFVIIEKWELFLQWNKHITNGLMLTVNKSIELGTDWVANDNSFSNLITTYNITHKELGMNTIIFNNGFSYEIDGFQHLANGIAKIILTPHLWIEINNLNDSLTIAQYLRNEELFCYLALEPNSNNILDYAFDQFATAIFNNKNYINAAFEKFKIGVVLEFKALIHEQFQLQQISAMKLNSDDLK